MHNKVYIGLGSNLEDSIKHVRQAMQELRELPGVSNFLASSIYRSKPLGGLQQPDYINAVVCFSTSSSAHELLDQCQEIENRHGRVRQAERWSSRTLDLDIILYGEQIIADDRLNVPHPGMKDRSFVLYPLAELDPDLKLPDNSILQHWLSQCPAEGLIKIE